jgi:hypothetical protein
VPNFFRLAPKVWKFLTKSATKGFSNRNAKGMNRAVGIFASNIYNSGEMPKRMSAYTHIVANLP